MDKVLGLNRTCEEPGSLALDEAKETLRALRAVEKPSGLKLSLA